MTRSRTVAALLSSAALIASAAAADATGMKMTTEVPAGIATPDSLETRLGTLTLFDGVHYDRDSLIELGRRYAEAMDQLNQPGDQVSGKQVNPDNPN